MAVLGESCYFPDETWRTDNLGGGQTILVEDRQSCLSSVRTGRIACPPQISPMTAAHVYRFDRFRLDAGGRLLFRGDERIQLTPKAVDILVALLESRGATVGREELLRRVWSGVAVEEGTLSSHISLLRKTLGRQFIETIPKRGYRFVGSVEEAAGRILLAVLPFENLSGNRKHDSFSDGLTEEMITQLGRLDPRRLGVI